MSKQMVVSDKTHQMLMKKKEEEDLKSFDAVIRILFERLHYEQ